MKIVQSDVSLNSIYEKEETYSKQETLLEWGTGKPGLGGEKLNQTAPEKVKQDQLDLSEQAKAAIKKQSAHRVDDVTDEFQFISDADQVKIKALEAMLSMLLGRTIKFNLSSDIKIQNPQLSINSQNQAAQTPARQGWGVIYQRQEFYSESEQLSFSAKGVIKTADGKEINFDSQINMSRNFVSSNNLTVKGGDALIDPLVINFSGNSSQLTNTKYSFDLDADGQNEQISSLKEGSGFLALDSNNDGKINNGSELFGPASGNGFSDLAKQDSDQNGWIDENDPIFDKLRIWTKDASGNDHLFALGQKGIGAIFLGNVNTQFSLKDSNNQSLGEDRQTGIFIKEDGTTGTIQQIDFTV